MTVRFNQPEVDSWDQHHWRQERHQVYQQIESWCLSNNICFNSSYRGAVNSHDLLNHNYDKVVYAQFFDSIPTWSQWQQISQKCIELGKKVFVVTDNTVQFDPLPGLEFFSKPEYLGLATAYQDRYLENVDKKKLFSCFMQRSDSVRQSWFYFLQHQQLLNQGHVSFLLKQISDANDTKTGIDLFDYTHQHYHLDRVPHFVQAYNELRSNVPYCNFHEQHDLLPLILESKYSLTLETFATEDDTGCWSWTEKSLRDLQLPVLPLLFWQKGSAEILSNLGLRLPEYLWDFDNMSWPDRQQKILQILDNDSIIYNYSECLDRARHNRHQLYQWKLSFQQPGFLDSVFDSILSA